MSEVPVAVRAARWLLALVAVGHVVAIVVLFSLRDALGEEILGTQSGLTADQVGQLTNLELIRTGSFHLLLTLVCGIYALKLQAGRKRVFRIVLGSQIVSIIFGVVTWFISPEVLRWLTPPFVGTAIVILVLLVGSSSSRAYFFPRKSPELTDKTPS